VEARYARFCGMIIATYIYIIYISTKHLTCRLHGDIVGFERKEGMIMERAEIPSVDTVRKRYPDPISANGRKGGENEYCVMGAFLRTWLGCWYPFMFPDVGRVHWEISARIDGVDGEKLCRLIAGIMDDNDAGRFDAAWKKLGGMIELLRRQGRPVEERRGGW